MKKWDNSHDWQGTVHDFLGKDFWNDIRGIFKEEMPPYNIYESKEYFICLISLPGLKKIQDVSLFINHMSLTLKGHLQYPLEGFTPVHEELFQGSFEKQIKLPQPVKSKPVSATYERGLLIIQLERLDHEGDQETIIIEERD